MNRRKICVVTATRAEYGLLKNLLDDIRSDADLQLQLIATGSHLSPEFGYTLQHIINDGFIVDKKIEMLLSSDTPVAVSKSMGLAHIGFAEAYDELKPDMVVVLGDRFELIPIVSAANIARIPVAHIHGGEITEGAIDEIFRHAVTKLSNLHFTAVEEYAKRVIQMGEEPSRVFNVGGTGLDNIQRMTLLSKEQLEQSLGFPFNQKNLLITYHPETCETSDYIQTSFSSLLHVIDGLDNTSLIFTKANADVGGRIINQMIDDFVAQRSEKSIAFDSLGQLRYLSALQYVDAMVGNSSSGIIEAPSFHIGTINIGDRQKGRVRAASIIDTPANPADLVNAFNKLYSVEFQKILTSVVNPYGKGDASQKIKAVLKSIDLNKLKTKVFYDIAT